MGGACCAGTRDKITYGRERGSEMCGIMQENVKSKMQNARMGILSAKKRAKERFNVTKLKARGYSQIYCDVVDDSDFGFLTRFEADNYQICKVTMDSFERILKEFQEKEETNIMSKHQIVEAFKNRKYLIEIENEYSLSYVLLTHPLFQKDPDSIYIPYLQLLSILYCASTLKMKAIAFYQMVKVENTNRIPRNDPYLVEYIKKLLEISWVLAVDMYEEFNEDDTPQSTSEFSIEDQEFIFKQLYAEFIDQLFVRDEKLAEEVFCHRFERELQSKYLQPYELRNIIDIHRKTLQESKQKKAQARQ